MAKMTKGKTPDYSQLEFIYSYEKNISLPVKWAMIIACFTLTYFLNREIIFKPIFFNGYIVTVGLSLLLTIIYSFKNLRYIKIISFLSFAQDIFFVSFLLQFTGGVESLLHIVYCMFIIRAAINYPSIKDMLIVSFLIFSPIYFLGLYWAEGSFSYFKKTRFLIQYLFLILVILSSFGVVYVIVKQKENIERNMQEIKNLQAQLIQSGKLAGIGQLAGGISHEINNPLANILGLTQLMLREGKCTADHREDLLKIERSAIRCKRIIESLLRFSRQGSFEPKDVSISNVIDDTLSLVGHQIELLNIKLITEINNGLPKVMADAGQIQQVFMNIILNAIDAMPKGGELKIKTDIVKIDNKDYVRVAFQDTGIGIPQENINRIFEPFFTTKEVGKGTGLGLSIAYGIIKDHKGDIKVKSAPGRGATFEVLLPVA